MLSPEVGHVVFKLDAAQLMGAILTTVGFGFALFRKFTKLNNLLTLTVDSVNKLGIEVAGMKKSLEVIAKSEVRIEHLEKLTEDHEDRMRGVESVVKGFYTRVIPNQS